jgi:hypothetical protein
VGRRVGRRYVHGVAPASEPRGGHPTCTSSLRVNWAPSSPCTHLAVDAEPRRVAGGVLHHLLHRDLILRVPHDSLPAGGRAFEGRSNRQGYWPQCLR